jgi:peptidoglycan/LPS O-acetylase OafA/YrhL
VVPLVVRTALFFAGASSYRIFNGLDTRADALLAGCAIGFGLSYGLFNLDLVRQWRRLILSVVGISVLVLLVATTWNVPIILTAGYSYIAAMWGVFLLLCMAEPGSAVVRALSVPPLLWIGRRSYGIYLWHFPIMQLIAQYTDSWQIITGAGFALSFLAGMLSYTFIEKPFLSIKVNFSSERAPKLEQTST